MQSIRLTVFLLVCAISPSIVSGQDTSSLLLKGIVIDSRQNKLGAVKVSSDSNPKGTLSNRKGEFNLRVGVNDRVFFQKDTYQSINLTRTEWSHEVLMFPKVIEMSEKGKTCKIDSIFLNEIALRPKDLKDVKIDNSRIIEISMSPIKAEHYRLNIKYE